MNTCIYAVHCCFCVKNVLIWISVQSEGMIQIYQKDLIAFNVKARRPVVIGWRNGWEWVLGINRGS